MVKTKINRVGERHGRLVVLRQAEDHVSPKGKHSVQWWCLCDCGNEVSVPERTLRMGTGKSCGCLQRELHIARCSKNNTYDLTSEDYGIGYTENNEQFWFDKEDYDKIKNYCWHYGTGGYLMANSKDGNNKVIQFHRLVMGVLDKSWKEVIVDHIKHGTMNEHKYDNRKENLRLVTRSDNNFNIHKRKDNTSGTTGVTWHGKHSYWEVTIGNEYVGHYHDYDDAVKARHDAEIKRFGDLAFKGDDGDERFTS